MICDTRAQRSARVSPHRAAPPTPSRQVPVLLSCCARHLSVCFFFFFNDTATTEIYTLSLHDALPISPAVAGRTRRNLHLDDHQGYHLDRKSTRLNSSHGSISYAVFCLKKKRPSDSRHHRPRPIPTTARAITPDLHP